MREGDGPAEVVCWPRRGEAPVVEGQIFPTLREALSAALALAEADENPWIVMEDGTILTPHWIRLQRPSPPEG